MKTTWDAFKIAYKVCKKDYLEIGCGLPFGSVRVEATDPKGTKHSLVITRPDFIKVFGGGLYQYITSTNGMSTEKSARAWFDYDEYKTIKKEEDEEFKRRARELLLSEEF